MMVQPTLSSTFLTTSNYLSLFIFTSIFLLPACRAISESMSASPEKCVGINTNTVKDTGPSRPAACVERVKDTPDIPYPLLAGYASWGECDEKIVTAVKQGVNVVIWFNLQLDTDERTHKPTLKGSLPKIDCIVDIINEINDDSVIHLVSIGGWNTALPNLVHSAEEYTNLLTAWNERNVKTGDGHWRGFDGFDWDLEGNDDVNEVRNHLQLEHLDLVHDISKSLKEIGYIITFAPSQSYLDVESNEFDLNLSHTPSWKPDFPYHGLNAYAYFLMKGTPYDWFSVQLYEGWSRANYQLRHNHIRFGTYTESLVAKMSIGWSIDFGQQLGGTQVVSVPSRKLVMGLANGWTQPTSNFDTKFLFVTQSELEQAWDIVDFAGFMYWTIWEEGKYVKHEPFYMADAIASIFNHPHSVEGTQRAM